VVGILEFSDAGFETGYILSENLRPRLSSPIVILAKVALLGTLTLLTSRLCAVTSLQGGEKMFIGNIGDGDGRWSPSSSFCGEMSERREHVAGEDDIPATETCLSSLQSRSSASTRSGSSFVDH
jgi:hypothetical protein